MDHVVRLPFVRPAHTCGLHAVLGEEFLRSAGRIDLVAVVLQHLAGVQQVHLRTGIARGDHHGLFRNTVPDRNHRRQQRFAEIVADATHFAGRRHIHAEHRVGIVQPRERELRRLHADPVDIEIRVVRFFVRSVEHDPRRGLDEVAFQHLRHEREAARRAQVTFDHLHVVVLRKELDIERAADVQLFGDLATDLLDAAGGFEVDLLRREYQRGVPRVDAGEFDMFRNRVFDHFAVVRHGVEFDLLGVLQELRHDHRILFRHFGRQLQERLQFLGVVAYVHRRARKHIRRTHQHRIAYLADEVVHFIHVRKLFPGRLVDAQLVEHTRELVAVFSAVDRQRRRAEHRNILAVQPDREVVRDLSAGRDDHAFRHLQVEYVQHPFERQFVEIEPVAHIVVGRNGLGVIVDHDRLVTQLAGRLHGIHRAPVELDRTADPVSARTEHDDRFFILEIRNLVLRPVVSHIEVVGQLRIFRSNRIDPFDRRQHIVLLADGADAQRLLLDIAVRVFDEAGDLEVRKTEPLGFLQYGRGHVFDLIVFAQYERIVVDIFQFAEEPGVDLGQVVDPIDRITFFERLGDREDTQVGRMRQFFFEVTEFQVAVADESVHPLPDHPQSFLDDLLERLADRHDLADGLHARSDLARNTGELAQVPTRDFADQVVERRGHVSRIRRSHLADLVERIAQGQFGRHERQRIARSLRRQRRRTAQPGVHLDHAVVVRLGVERVLDIAFADDPDVADHLFGKFLQQGQFLVVQRTGRGHHNALAGVDSQRIEVLHTGHREAVVVLIADHFEFDLLPSLQRLLDQYLLRIGERAFAQRPELIEVAAYAAAQAAQRIGRTYHHREPDPIGRLDGRLHAFDSLADRGLDFDLVQFLYEQVAVFGRHDRFDRRSEHLHAVFLQRAAEE